jgi:hypothetical protein
LCEELVEGGFVGAGGGPQGSLGGWVGLGQLRGSGSDDPVVYAGEEQGLA